jgi:hypothetical protein
MSHLKYNEIGATIATRWGLANVADEAKTITGLDGDDKIMCLLAAVHSRLEAAQREVSRHASERADADMHAGKAARYANDRVVRELRRIVYQLDSLTPSNAIADGMLSWMRLYRRVDGSDILPAMLAKLSPRARKALKCAEITSINQITTERLTGIANCGSTTITELLAFAEAHKSDAALHS